MIGIVTALPKEYAAMEVMLHDPEDYTAPGQAQVGAIDVASCRIRVAGTM